MILPVDLNALLHRLEARLGSCYVESNSDLADFFMGRAEFRRQQLQTLFFDQDAGFFADLDSETLQPTGVRSLAAAPRGMPVSIATYDADEVMARLRVVENKVEMDPNSPTLTEVREMMDEIEEEIAAEEESL